MTAALSRVPPWPCLARVDAAWCKQHGVARGTTMGRYSPDYLARHRLYMAWQDDALVGFVSFHTTRRQWCLDLVRPAPGAPDGTAQLLIAAALQDAARLGIPQVSLAAVPDLPHRTGPGGQGRRGSDPLQVGFCAPVAAALLGCA